MVDKPHWTDFYTFECDSLQETCTAAELYKRYDVFIRKHRGFSLINVLKGDTFMADDGRKWKRIR